MEISKVITNDLKIISNIGNRFVLHFGFQKTKEENETSYICFERTYAVKPTFNLVNKHISQLNPEYCITKDEWDKNEGKVF